MEFKHPKYYAELRKIYKQAETLKQQASSQQASKVSSTVDHDPRAIDEQAKPSLKSSWIMDPGTSIMVPWPWCLAKIKVSLGCVVWKAIWCGENLILLLPSYIFALASMFGTYEFYHHIKMIRQIGVSYIIRNKKSLDLKKIRKNC